MGDAIHALTLTTSLFLWPVWFDGGGFNTLCCSTFSSEPWTDFGCWFVGPASRDRDRRFFPRRE